MASNPYKPDDRTNGRLAWAEGFEAGVDMARDNVSILEGCRCGCNQGAWADWSAVDYALDKIKEEA
jgi:hypothetical protein